LHSVAPGTASTEGVAFVVNLVTKEVSRLEAISIASVGLKERDDLQRWITEHPELVGPGLLLVTSEFDRWQVRDQRVADRLDVLFLDAAGCPVVVELKRDRASDSVDLQALKYAAYCSQLTLDDLVEEYARYHDVDPDEARKSLLEHAPSLEEQEPGRVAIRSWPGSSVLRSPRWSSGCATTGSTSAASS
jgi:hypothetical protein